MRNLFSLSLFFFLPVLLFAQDKYQLFYAPNAYSLTPKQEADLSKILQARPLSVLKIQPFTDDLGSDIDNEVLAENRAKTIIQFVQKQGFEQLQFEQLPYERQPLDARLPAAEARQQLRRIDLYFYNAEEFEEVKNNDVWTSFYSKQRKEAQQFFSFSAQKGKFIEGKEGIQIDIPENSFLGPDGRPYQGQVSLVLQEALSMKDMILQNLSTSSNGELIETGGMIYLAAKGENGEELSLAEGKDLTVGFPGAAAALPGMQIFQGPNAADPHAEINWQPVGNPLELFVEEKLDSTMSFSKAYFDYKEELLYLLKEPFLAKTKKEVPKSFKLRSPRLKVERTFIAFEEYLAQKYPQKSGETEESYQRRIRKKKIKLRKKYNNKKRSWRNKYRAYQKDSSRYARARSRYEKEQKAYNEFLDREYKEAQEFLAYIEALSHEHLHELLDSCNQEIRRSYNPKRYNQAGSTVGGFMELLPMYQFRGDGDFELEIEKARELYPQFSFEQIDAYEEAFNRALGLFEKQLGQQKNNWAKQLKDEKEQEYWDWPKDIAQEEIRLKLANLLKDERGGFTPLGQKKYAEIKKMFWAKKEYVSYKQWKTEAYSNCLLNMQKIEAEQQKANKGCKNVDSLAAEVLAKKERYGINKKEEQRKKTISRMKITGLGWINCDRFLNENGAKMNLILASASRHAQYFLIFKNINGIMRANSRATFKNVPKNYQAKLIGIKQFGDQIEFMEAEDKVLELDEKYFPFQKVSEKELAAKLDAL
ncbi:outer membrane protein/peptidoglycan-associated (lipo)protein [Saprospira grandis DSM 2844]|uniref:Outer membrane protein/peptidoglycan-associated (Lipo)protein n=1 Tax=Saprospira grandis DSM 2844 TaxID=694433 RepID=J0NWY0_9BACT|nr:OmpA family protein [Saprospira grandis]EJF52009.1 outer membrane protein/peptidoglycan-associated (lipo)protein [Saprospira grandis DSM 2844]